MAAMMFDGKAYAAEILKRISDKVAVIDRPVKLATIYNGENEAAGAYTRIKSNTADNLGILFEAYDLNEVKTAAETIKALNKDPETTGVMIQLPFAGGRDDEKLCRLIAKEKDADGLNPESGILPATVKAVMAIIDLGIEKTHRDGNWPLVTAVIGSRGNVGRGVLKAFENDIRFEPIGMDKGELSGDRLRKAEIIISAAGQPGLINKDMIKPGAVVIDVGYPEGDVNKEVFETAGFLTPVPGGVGPVTVAMLFRNLLEIR